MSGSAGTAIVNPRSADGSTGLIWADLARRITEAGHEIETRLTDHQGHAAELTREALRAGAKRIYAVGGDGTVNEVINGFFEGERAIAPDAELGVLCRGTGCDFIKSLHLPKADEGGIERVLAGHAEPTDVGRVRYVNLRGEEEMRYFINIAEAGLGGQVVSRVNNASKAAGGFLTFLGASLASIAGNRNQPAEIVIDGKYVRNLPVCNVVVANGKYFGGGMKIMPHADLADGKLDVLVMGDFSRADLLANVAKVYSGTHLGHPKVEVFQAESIRVTSVARLPLDLDGECPGTTPAQFDVVPGAIRVIR
ncbi:MAG: diacylglycerol kinase family lipid kinase [Candidatus Sericytochromatia bacterium]|nr:diacylglycerol kinase family lipid kinase [Candidatus Tanganyikabacteria bacterium]